MLFLCGVPCLALIVRYIVCKTEAAAAIREALQEKVPSSGQSDKESFSAVGRSAPCGAGDFLTLAPYPQISFPQEEMNTPSPVGGSSAKQPLLPFCL